MRKILLKVAVVLTIVAVTSGTPAVPAPLKDYSGPDPLEAIRLLIEKQNLEEKELKEFSEMVLIPAGTFRMGSGEGDEDEKPVHTVYLDAFYINKYEVTQIQFTEVMGMNPSYFKNCPRCPVERVTYHQALSYCRAKHKKLPTEAEWEKAERAGSTEPFYWGGEAAEHYAWFGNNADGRTHPVGQKEPNRYGLYDMAGNVREWVLDKYDKYYYRYSPRNNPAGPAQGGENVFRGGGWGHSTERLRSAHRESAEPATRYINGGFRCAADAPGDGLS